jgi:hypothetical protein
MYYTLNAQYFVCPRVVSILTLHDVDPKKNLTCMHCKVPLVQYGITQHIFNGQQRYAVPAASLL